MAKYYVNDREQKNGDHEVHKEGCLYLPLIISKTYLGDNYFCDSAVSKAKNIYVKSNGCYHCTNSCHTS